jgi:hypothetical protein
MVAQECVKSSEGAEVTKRNTVSLVDVIITQEYEARFARQATVATNKVTINYLWKITPQIQS